MGQARAQRQRQSNVMHRQRVQQTAMQDAKSQLRRAYFAQAGNAISRYSIMFDRVVKHVMPMWKASRGNIKDIRYADDLVQAVACVQGKSVAWTDLIEQHERILIRASRDRFEEADSILLVRRMFVDLRRCSESDVCDSQLSLRNYYGISSIRGWLCRCLAQAMNDFAYGRKFIDEKPMRFCEHCSEALGWDAMESKLSNKLPDNLPNVSPKPGVVTHVTPPLAVGGSGTIHGSSGQ